MKAIILAAGMGTRLKEFTESTPKSLVKINDKPFIHYQIEYLIESGITDITVVVGYLAEKFEYLKEKYNVRLLYNEKYDVWNNFYSLYCAKDIFEDAYLIDADNYLSRNIFKSNMEKSHYFTVKREECVNEYFVYTDDKNKIINITIESGIGNIVAGVSYWDKETANKIILLMDEIFKEGRHKNLYWDDVIRLNLDKLDVYEHRLSDYDIYEVDTIEDYNKLNNILRKKA